jgi:hypothetical protein
MHGKDTNEERKGEKLEWDKKGHRDCPKMKIVPNGASQNNSNVAEPELLQKCASQNSKSERISFLL